MKLYTEDQLAALPAGVVYSPYTPHNFGPLIEKLETNEKGEFNTVELSSQFDWPANMDLEEFVEKRVKDKGNIPLELMENDADAFSGSRYYAVFSQEDLMVLTERLAKLTEAYPLF